MAKNSICHVEWNSTSLERSRDFLSDLFGWTFKPFGGSYLLFMPHEGIGGGINKVDKVVPGESPVVYVEVDKIEPYVEKIKKLGGSIAVPKTEIPDIGWFSHFKDNDGNLMGLYEGIPQSK